LGEGVAMKKMGISVDFSALARTKWYEFAIRFIFGGTITVCAGILAKKYGPSVGGLFLAFPAIFPAAITLVEKNEREKKRKAGMSGAVRGRTAAALDAAGAAMGTVGLAAFAYVAYKGLAQANAAIILSAGSLIWLLVSFGIWKISKVRHRL
jgi:hypothetical protein